MDPLFKFFEVHGAIFTLQIKYIQLLIKYEGKKIYRTVRNEKLQPINVFIFSRNLETDKWLKPITIYRELIDNCINL